MVLNTDNVDKYIGNMLNSFLNKQHSKKAEDYLFVRERIDKVKKTNLIAQGIIIIPITKVANSGDGNFFPINK